MTCTYILLDKFFLYILMSIIGVVQGVQSVIQYTAYNERHLANDSTKSFTNGFVSLCCCCCCSCCWLFSEMVGGPVSTCHQYSEVAARGSGLVSVTLFFLCLLYLFTGLTVLPWLLARSRTSIPQLSVAPTA